MQNDRLMCAPKKLKNAPNTPKKKLYIALGTAALFAVLTALAVCSRSTSKNEISESVIVIDREETEQTLIDEGWKPNVVKTEVDSVIARFTDAGLLILDKSAVIAAPEYFSPDITAAVRLKLAGNPDNRIAKENFSEALTSRNGKKVFDKAEALWKAAGF